MEKLEEIAKKAPTTNVSFGDTDSTPSYEGLQLQESNEYVTGGTGKLYWM